LSDDAGKTETWEKGEDCAVEAESDEPGKIEEDESIGPDAADAGGVETVKIGDSGDIGACESEAALTCEQESQETGADDKAARTAESELGYPLLAPPEKTGLTPEEEAYAPAVESRVLPRSVFIAAFAALILAFGIGGGLYYRSSVMPERLFQAATRMFESGNYAEALDIYESVQRLKPDRRDTLFRMGYSMEMLGRDTEAIDAYSEHIKNEPYDAEALFRLGTLYFRHGMNSEAEIFLLRAIERGGMPASADYMIGAAREALGNPKRAADSYIEVIRSNADDVETLYASSRALMRLGYYREALDGFTMMESRSASDDRRAFHSINAAKAMLGWPTDPSLVIAPGKAIGNLALGVTSGDVLEKWGMPLERVTEGEHAVWGYGGRLDSLETLVYLESDRVIEIVTSGRKYKTTDGLGLTNFLDPKYENRFERWSADMGDAPTLYRYTLKGGGLAFYSVGGYSSAVVYSGENPLSRVDSYEWVKLQ
jgi:tetratricopeptide (TPR) repeat protein